MMEPSTPLRSGTMLMIEFTKEAQQEIILMRTHFPQPVIASAAWQSRGRRNRRPVQRDRRVATLFAMTKRVRMREVIGLIGEYLTGQFIDDAPIVIDPIVINLRYDPDDEPYLHIYA